MRFLIVAASVLACAVAAPSGLYGHGLLGAPLGLAAPWGLGHAAVGHGAIPAGDIQGAAIDAHVVAADHSIAAVDAVRGQHDQVAELHGRAANAAEEHAWSAVNAGQIAHAAHQSAAAGADGHAAGVAPIVAKSLAGHGLAYGHGVAAHGLGLAGHGLAAHGLGWAGHGVANLGYAGHGFAHSVATQSLSQTHPAVLHGHLGYGHGLAHY